MSLLTKNFAFGDLQAVIMDFEIAGDVLAAHSHSQDSTHITIVARGEVKFDIGIIENDEFIVKETHELKAGACIDPDTLHHRVTALVDNSRIYNIYKVANISMPPR